MPGSVVKGSLSVRVVKSKLGTNGDELVRPPGNADGMLGILGGKPGPAPTLSLKYSFRTVKNALGAIRNIV